MHVVNARVGSQSDARSIMCRLRLRFDESNRLATVKNTVDEPRPSESSDTRFTAEVLSTLPHEKRASEQDPKGISEVYQIVRYVSLYSFSILTSTLFF